MQLKKGVTKMASEDNFLRLDVSEIEAQKDMELKEQFEKEFFKDLVQKYERNEIYDKRIDDKNSRNNTVSI